MLSFHVQAVPGSVIKRRRTQRPRADLAAPYLEKPCLGLIVHRVGSTNRAPQDLGRVAAADRREQAIPKEHVEHPVGAGPISGVIEVLAGPKIDQVIPEEEQRGVWRKESGKA
jgi:hypothetical protein